MKQFLSIHHKLFFIIFLPIILLSGCVAAAFVAGSSAGGLVVSDQRDWKTRSEDSYIEHRLDVNIIQDPQFKTSNLDLSSFDCVVLLVGQTPDASLKSLAEKIAQSTPNVKKIYNEITVGPSISFSQKSKDVWLTSAVKSALLVKSGLRSGSIKVLTENGTVYLMGLVTKEQAELAVDAARRVDGVKNVVKVFEYL